MRNVLAVVPKGNAEMVAAAIRTIFAQPDAEHVEEQFDVIAGMLGRQLPKVEAMLRDAKDDLLAFTGFPQVHWRQIWSTNPLERVNKEIKTPHRRRRRLPQSRGPAAPRRSGPGRAARRMGSRRPPLLLRAIHDPGDDHQRRQRGAGDNTRTHVGMIRELT